MESIVIEVPEKMKQFVEQQVRQGNYQSASAMFQSLVADLIRTRARKELEQSLVDALDEYERGECTEWTRDDIQIIKDDYIRRCQLAAKP